MEEIVQLNSIPDYCKYCGFEVLHPLVAVVDMAEAQRNYPECKLNYGLYALWLKQGVGCTIRYGRRNYDYQDGTVVSFAPGQVVQVEPNGNESASAIGLLFHPDLIHGTSLGRKIERYSFFSYHDAEALHLSEREREQYLMIIESIKRELRHDIDRHSKELLCDNIEMLLDQCLRFYDRQFITREKVNGDVLADFERILNAYFTEGVARNDGFPSVARMADELHFSVGYFGDLIKKETGQTAQQYIQNKLINLAKEALLGTDLPVSEIALNLGFDYPQHFTRMFKKVTGKSPSEFRMIA
ncbi:MAG: helix-turn-helix transcriptional regulator [Bacteroidales bacterium]|nr:helix-turn-helix transcriptional regulator [Bacteroidales bacterium]